MMILQKEVKFSEFSVINDRIKSVILFNISPLGKHVNIRSFYW